MAHARSRKGRDAALLASLPPRDSPYSFDNLSQGETDALEAAFGDGFGNVGSVGHEAQPLPKEVRSGLLRHSYFARDFSEYDHEEFPDEFWESFDGEGPVPFERFPLGFVLRRLRLYFGNQLDRFCVHLISEKPSRASMDRQRLQELAAYRLYEKPWYEFHAVQLLDWIESAQRDAVGKKHLNLTVLLISSFSGELGRLVEQYYWRFRFERAAITGVGARKGASTGGKAKARLHKAEHHSWQKAASEIWARRPTLNKIAVAEAIKKQLGVARTAKHIARFIKHP